MAYGHRTHRGLMAGAVALSLALSAGAGGAAFAAKSKPDRGVTSQESRNLPSKYARQKYRSPAAKSIRASRDSVEKLKKSSFWNKRPYQFASPLLVEGLVYVGCDAGFFYGIDAGREKKLWKFKTRGPVHSRAAFADGTVYFGDTEGDVYALDAATGEKKWSATLDSEILATPLILGPTLYVATMSGRLYAIERLSGGEQWHTASDEREFGFSVREASSPIEVNGMIIVGTSTGELKAMRASDGGVVWDAQLGSLQAQVYDVDSTPLYVNGRLFAATADGRLFSLDPQSGKVLWDSRAGGNGDLTFRDGRLYSTGKGSLYSIDPESGMTVWQQDFETGEISSPAAGDGFVAVVSTREKFSIVESTSGDVAYERYVGKGSYGDPVISGNMVYLLDNTGRLYAFKVRKVEPKPERKKGKAARAELVVEEVTVPN